MTALTTKGLASRQVIVTARKTMTMRCLEMSSRAPSSVRPLLPEAMAQSPRVASKTAAVGVAEGQKSTVVILLRSIMAMPLIGMLAATTARRMMPATATATIQMTTTTAATKMTLRASWTKQTMAKRRMWRKMMCRRCLRMITNPAPMMTKTSRRGMTLTTTCSRTRTARVTVTATTRTTMIPLPLFVRSWEVPWPPFVSFDESARTPVALQEAQVVSVLAASLAAKRLCSAPVFTTCSSYAERLLISLVQQRLRALPITVLVCPRGQKTAGDAWTRSP